MLRFISIRVVGASIVLSNFLAQADSWNHRNHRPEPSTTTTASLDNPTQSNNNEMGQAIRMVSYDRAANERAAIPVLNIAGEAMQWFRLDDGVMGGQSETAHQAVVVDADRSSSSSSSSSQQQMLHFTGTINTNGGGFASIRSKIPQGILDATTTSGVRIRCRGDGKTYKFLLSEGTRNAGAPMSRTPSWQADIPTKNDGQWQETVIPFDKLLPSFGGPSARMGNSAKQEKLKFDPTIMREIGFMLSLKLSNGSPNPKETFGEGVFPFSLHIQSVEPVASDTCDSSENNK